IGAEVPGSGTRAAAAQKLDSQTDPRSLLSRGRHATPPVQSDTSYLDVVDCSQSIQRWSAEGWRWIAIFCNRGRQPASLERVLSAAIAARCFLHHAADPSVT